MVGLMCVVLTGPLFLSVLALSSRFDGPLAIGLSLLPPTSFSTRSVESF